MLPVARGMEVGKGIESRVLLWANGRYTEDLGENRRRAEGRERNQLWFT